MNNKQNNYLKNIQNIDNILEIIVKYNGSLEKIKKDLNLSVEILSCNYAIITLKKEDISKLILYTEIEYIEAPRNLTFVLDNAISNSCISTLKINPTNLTGKGTIVGIIDSGISYMHKDFRNPDGSTRILYIWDQTIKGNSPKGFLNGTLYTKNDIDNALKSPNPLSIVPHTDDIGHGTAVAGVACGNGATSNGKYTGVASESSIIVVKLGETGIKSFAKNTEIMRAIKFILDKSIELNMPVSINLSFGTNDGSHTGNSLFETYIDDMCNIWKTSICVATGNEGSSSHHYKGFIKPNEKLEIEIQISPDLKNLEIVLFKNFCDIFEIKIISPNGLETGYLNQTLKETQFNFGNSSLYIYFGEPVPYTLEQEIFFNISSNMGYIENGVWKIIILPKNIIDGNFNIWLPITEMATRNTRFLLPNQFTTLTIPSTASNVISVGGYNSLINSIADFSGRGFTANEQVKPDIVAPAINIKTTSNNLNYDTFSGTSIANPFVTGACSLLMQWGIIEKNDLFLYGERIKAFLRLGAKRKDNISYPNEEWGFGSLCLSKTLEYLKLYKN